MRSVKRDLSALTSWRVLPTAGGVSGVIDTSAGMGPMPVNSDGKRAESTDSANTASRGASMGRCASRCTAMARSLRRPAGFRLARTGRRPNIGAMIPLSILDLAPVTEGSTPAQTFANTLDLARAAERAGYKRFWLAEHHNMPGIASAATAVLIGHVA